MAADSGDVQEWVPDLVAWQAATKPDGLAVAHGAEQLTYGDLNARAARVAARLGALGVGIDVPVAVLLPRSVGLVIAALGIMKAGGAYLPIDPAYPDDRVAFVLRDARPPVVMTDERLATRLARSGSHLVTIETFGHASARPDVAASFPHAPDQLAYVIYTSGSTGRPKGVALTHGGLLNLVRWHHGAFTITPADRATQHASPGFDAAVWELWPYLTAGASVHAVDEGTRLDPERLRDWIIREGITVSFLPTPLAERVMALDWPPLTQLRLLLTGADTLHAYPPPSLPFQVVNNYGPTECTVVATSGVVRADEAGERLPTIGRPIAHTQIHVLDERMQPVPVGAPGELYIGGAGVGRGYLDDADLTAQKFVPDPFGASTGGHLYRTGDLGCVLADGRIAFRGRMDGQVKIRGHRIETDEIVAVLNRDPAIQASAVVAHESRPGERRLVAYVVARPTTPLSQRDLVTSLAAALPDYMMPATFVVLDELPLTASGKVDRAALPAPHDTNTLRAEAHRAPSTRVEERLAETCAMLLSLDRIGVDDNFFLLGGHSLLGAQLLVRVREMFGVVLPLRTLFACPTVAALAAEIERETATGRP